MRASLLRAGSLLIVACTLASLVAAAFWVHASHANPDPGAYDVVVVGAGPGGIAAGIQAARMGARVALLEETDWVGGQMTAAGVGTMDEGNPAARASGLYHEFAQRVTSYYQAQHKAVDTCYYSLRSLCVEPRVGQLILRQMIDAESGRLDLFTGTHVSAITRVGNRVTGVVAGNRTFTSGVVVDAEPYGDVLAMAGAAYRLGNDTSDDPGVGQTGCVQDITYSPVIKEYPGGVPAPLTFTGPPPGYNASVARHFAAVISATGSPLLPRTGIPPRPLSFPAFAAYRGVPDLSNPQSYTAYGHVTRTSLNLGNDYPDTGNLDARYISDPSFRAEANANAKLLSLQMVYYIQHDLGYANWSLADDEGYNTSYNLAHRTSALQGFEAFEDQMPQAPYVREGRRLVGMETLTGNELAIARNDPSHAPRHPDAIAVGYYAADLHGCLRNLEPAFDTPQDMGRGGAFEVPLGIVIPASVDNLLVTDNNLSTSREANGATREQPIAMDIGQAVGALAALATQHHEAPRDVPVASVQTALLAAKSVIALP